MNTRISPTWLIIFLSLSAAGCFRSTKLPVSKAHRNRDAGAQNEPGGQAGKGSPDDDGDDGDGDIVLDAGVAAPGTSSALCIRGGYCGQIQMAPIQVADLLFVVDNSGSMRQEQAALQKQFPPLIAALTQGRTSDGKTYPAMRDLHLGVVSTDMGLAGIVNNFPGCSSQRHVNGGDDGVLQHPGKTGPGCDVQYPPWLGFRDGSDDPNKTAADFGCISALGTGGCGFEQQLEAGLKALWPKNYIDRDGNVYPPEKNPILFLSTTSEGRFGHGDVPLAEGGNDGFMRKNSVLAIVVVTDEEDCSSKNTSHFVSTNDPANPLSKQGINLRCFYNKQNLFEIDRYVKAFQALRPGYEQNLIFALIAGVPTELVSPEARAGVDFGDKISRDAYYDMVLSNPAMIERPQNENVPAIANIAPSCSRTDALGERADAYPPRRMVEVAKGIGENAIVQSICQDDFGPAMDAIIELTASRALPECLASPIARNGVGKIDCDVLWEIPSGKRCKEFPFLSEVSAPRAQQSPSGSTVCKVEQISVANGSPAKGEGFYYDDFSMQRQQVCRPGAAGRIAWTPGAAPPVNVRAHLDCAPKALQ